MPETDQQTDNEFITTHYARLWTRFLARMADYAVFNLTLAALVGSLCFALYPHAKSLINFHLLAHKLENMTLLQTITMSLSEFVLTTIIYTLSDSLICKKFGRNLGHKLYGIRPISLHQETLSYPTYLKRAFLLNLINFPYIGAIFYIVLYLKYRKTKVTYWDRLTQTRVIAEDASLKRRILCVAIPAICFTGLCIVLALLTSPPQEKATPHPAKVVIWDEAFLKKVNSLLPKRINDITILQNVQEDHKDLVFHYLISKKDDKNFILSGFGNILKYRTFMFYTTKTYYCEGKGQLLQKRGYSLTQIFIQQGKPLLETHINPGTCLR